MLQKLIAELTPPFDSRGFIMWASGWILIAVGLSWVHYTRLADINREQAKSEKPRKEFIDFLRGWAITFVTFYHLMYNFSVEGFVPAIPYFDRSKILGDVAEFWVYFLFTFLILTEVIYYSVYAGYFWFLFITAVCIPWHYAGSQVSGVGIMLTTMGMASYVQNRDGIKWTKVLTRFGQLVIVSVLISIVTYVVLPDEWIYFGAIHCIALLSIIHLPFVVFPQFSIVGAIFIFIHYVFYKQTFFLDVPYWRISADYMPWFVNLGYVLLGVFLAHMGVHEATHLPRCIWGGFRPGIRWNQTIFPFLGRHSLFIFIVHQIILFPLVKILAIFL
jgi:uncharacterized membrane protein